jgi:copper(I)-binding protein
MTSHAAVRPIGQLAELGRAAIAPMACAAVLLALLASWVMAGGGGVISRVRIEVTLAAITAPPLTRTAAGHDLAVYLTIRNLSGRPETLRSASTPDSARVVFTGGPASDGFVIPAHGVLTLSPSGRDILLIGSRQLQAGQSVPLTLDFPGVGRFTVTATVTRGTP